MLAGCGSGINYATQGKVDAVTGGTLHFIALGDYGQDGTPTQQTQVAFAMAAYVKKWNLSPSALLMLGDSFYGSLPGGAGSTRWQTQFEAMYPDDTFNCPALAIPGNHDYEVLPVSKYEAEQQYAAETQGTRWTMPAQSYRVSFPDVNPIVTFLCLDSNMPNEPAQPLPTGHFYTMDDASRLAQIQWLENELAQGTTAPFTIVLGHHPLFSNGEHGDNQTLIRDWGPLFQQYKVPLYLAGHDHDMQHLEISGYYTSFAMSGGGGQFLYPLPGKRHGGYSQETYGFTHLQITTEHIIVRHIDPNGKLLHKFTKLLDGTVQM